jgi:pSer/pThr/pTyr-binding forkhead associated (FHA) protein
MAELEKDTSSSPLFRKLDLRQFMVNQAPPRPHTTNFAHLTLVLERDTLPIFKFDDGVEVRIGRGVGLIRWNNLDLTPYDQPKNSVSRRHCRLYKNEAGYFVEDLASTNGTWLNGKRLVAKKPYPLRDKDHLLLGGVGMWVFLPRMQAEMPQNKS